MKITVFRGSKEIGGSLIEIASKNSKIILDVGYPLFLNRLSSKSPLIENRFFMQEKVQKKPKPLV
jgi:mRNA degradation ribonuclease J1/J2